MGVPTGLHVSAGEAIAPDKPEIFGLDEDPNKDRAIEGSSNQNPLLIVGLALPTAFSGLACASHPGPLPLFLDKALTVLHLSDSVRRIRRTRTRYGVSWRSQSSGRFAADLVR